MKGEENSIATTDNSHNSTSPTTTATTTHVLMFPMPAQGHVNSFLKLAELLAIHNLHVTFLNIEFIHHNLLRFGDIQALSKTYPTLQFKTIPDDFSQNNPKQPEQHVLDVFKFLNLKAKSLLREFLVSHSPRISCIIGDGLIGGLINEVAREVGIAAVHFRTISAACFWFMFCVPDLFKSNQLPIRGDEDMDRIITGIPGLESLIRCRDLPSFCRETDSSSSAQFLLSTCVSETQNSLEAQALILNTFEDLEGPTLSHIRLHYPKVFTIGPLTAHLNSSRITESSYTGSLLEVDRSCMEWLDSQPLGSVIYVSFGSIATLTRNQLMELWYGLVNSKKRFLWVRRFDLVAGKEGEDEIPLELVEGTKERGFVVGWAPQIEVLGHKAIGGFLTHSGWNSTLESIVAGVPMICFPYFGDQQLNSRFVSEAWKLGLDMKDVCDRHVVEKMVNDVMVHRKEEFLKSTQAMAKLAYKSVRASGSSYSNLDALVQFIKSTSEAGSH